MTDTLIKITLDTVQITLLVAVMMIIAGLTGFCLLEKLFKKFKEAGIKKVFTESLNTIGGNYTEVEKVLKKECGKLGFNGTREQMIQLLFDEKVQPQLIQPTFIIDYPKEICNYSTCTCEIACGNEKVEKQLGEECDPPGEICNGFCITSPDGSCSAMYYVYCDDNCACPDTFTPPSPL